MELPNGYKLFQFAYRIPKRGTFIRVFDGMYKTIPNNVFDIIDGPHSFIIDAPINQFCRIGLINFIGNYPVPAKYPYPNFRLKLWPNKYGKIDALWITPNNKLTTGKANILSFSVTSMSQLPAEYQDLNLLSGYVSVDWLLYLFDYNFSMNNLNRFWPQNVLGDDWETKLKEYRAIIDDATRRNLQKVDMTKEFSPDTR